MKKWLKKINALLLGTVTSISASACNREPKPKAPTQKPTTNPVPSTTPVTKIDLNDFIKDKQLGIIKMANKGGPLYDELLVAIKDKNPITASKLTADDFIFKSFNDKQCTIVGKGKYDDTKEVTLHYEKDQRVKLNSNISTKQLGTFKMGTSVDLTEKMIKEKIINLNPKLENVDDIKITSLNKTSATVIANNNDKYFANDPEQFFHFNTINFEELDTSIMENDDMIHVTICNNNNEIFVLTNKIRKNHYKLYRLKNTLFEQINISVPPSKAITSITNLIADNNGNIWAIINHNIIYKHEVNTISLKPVTMKGIIEHKNIITALVIDSKGNIYAGANEGTKGTVYKSDGTNDFIPMKTIEHKITALVIDSKDNIYAGANEGTVYKYKNDGTNDFIPMKKLKYKITALVIDSKDNIYASYTKKEEVTVYKSDGTNDFVEKKLLLWDSTKKPINSTITSLNTNKAGNVYCIIDNRILYVYNEQTEEFKYIFSLNSSSDQLTAITFDQINNIYIATSEVKGGGTTHYKIYKYNKKTEEILEMSPTIIKPVVTLTTDQDSNIYAATGGGFHIPTEENEAKMFKARYNENE